MRIYKKWHIVLLSIIIAGCSSPPEPKKIKWNTPIKSMNESIPSWKENNIVVPSKKITGQWIIYKSNFNVDEIQSIDTYYATAHSSKIIIKAAKTEQYLNTRKWLLNNGSTGKIEFQFKKHCFLCNSVGIYFIREPEKK